jgi:hypothetical protein
MDDSQPNNDNRAERPENRTHELVQRKKAEHDELQRLLKERVDEMNANHGNLPQFVVRGASIVQLGHIDMHLEFDPVFSNPTEFVLVRKVGVPDNKKPLFKRGNRTLQRFRLCRS